MNFIEIKNKYGIIGHNSQLERAIEIAIQAAPTDLNVLINGESGTGKEVFPQIIHQYSTRKHGPYIAVNCGAIPEGTIDSELFGHEKGAFTGATETRKGYFEVANGGTIFLDEVGELPSATQARLLRVLETGEFIKVGSSKVQKTDVRVVAATNINFFNAIQKGKFREDLYYRLNTLPIFLPPLRERKEDIHLLFRKFANDCAVKYRMPHIKLTADAEQVLMNYFWPGNIRQLKNITEQICIVEKSREINAETLLKYLPRYSAENVPAVMKQGEGGTFFGAELGDKDVLLKVIADTRKELNELKSIVHELIINSNMSESIDKSAAHGYLPGTVKKEEGSFITLHKAGDDVANGETIEIEESLSLQDKEIDMIKKALIKHKGKRKYAAKELGISERTLYRKINEYNITE
ncbi:MAG: sigma-54 interaction domain-containing protein [Bacteroidia bacterium]